MPKVEGLETPQKLITIHFPVLHRFDAKPAHQSGKLFSQSKFQKQMFNYFFL